MTESSLSLANKGFYSIVSECCDGGNAAGYLLKLQVRIKRRLEKGIGQRRFRRQSETPYCEMSDLMVDRLLLQYLLSRQQYSTLVYDNHPPDNKRWPPEVAR